MRGATTSTRGRAAHAYAAQLGWAVFPLHTPHGDGCSCGKVACGRTGKHPRTRHGLHDASVCPEQIAKWWGSWPDANIGVATGERSGIVVVDIDDEKAQDDFAAKFGDLPTPVAITGRGRHIVFRHPGSTVPNSAGLIGLHIDVRGDGGYIVAPPSLHASGKRYSWDRESGMHPFDQAPAEMPTSLRDALAQVGRRQPGFSRVARCTSGAALGNVIIEGQRDSTLTRIAGALRRVGASVEMIGSALAALNATHVRPPLPDGDVERIARSVGRYAPTSDSSRPTLGSLRRRPPNLRRSR